MQRGRVWYYLRDFDLALVAVKNAIETLLQRSTFERDDENDSDAGEPVRGGDDDDEKPKEAEINRPADVNEGEFDVAEPLGETLELIMALLVP